MLLPVSKCHTQQDDLGKWLCKKRTRTWHTIQNATAPNRKTIHILAHKLRLTGNYWRKKKTTVPSAQWRNKCYAFNTLLEKSLIRPCTGDLDFETSARAVTSKTSLNLCNPRWCNSRLSSISVQMIPRQLSTDFTITDHILWMTNGL
jgi:hypothetical protein